MKSLGSILGFLDVNFFIWAEETGLTTFGRCRRRYFLVIHNDAGEHLKVSHTAEA